MKMTQKKAYSEKIVQQVFVLLGAPYQTLGSSIPLFRINHSHFLMINTISPDVINQVDWMIQLLVSMTREKILFMHLCIKVGQFFRPK